MHPPVGGWERQGDSGRAGKAPAQGPHVLQWWGFGAPESRAISGLGTWVPGLFFHCEGHRAPLLLGLCFRIQTLGGCGTHRQVRGPGHREVWGGPMLTSMPGP